MVCCAHNSEWIENLEREGDFSESLSLLYIYEEEHFSAEYEMNCLQIDGVLRGKSIKCFDIQIVRPPSRSHNANDGRERW